MPCNFLIKSWCILVVLDFWVFQNIYACMSQHLFLIRYLIVRRCLSFFIGFKLRLNLFRLRIRFWYDFGLRVGLELGLGLGLELELRSRNVLKWVEVIFQLALHLSLELESGLILRLKLKVGWV